MLRIWGRHTSINVQKVLWCADELSLEYEQINVGGEFGGLDTPQYLAMNPNSRIPTIEDGGFVLWEANTIVRYLSAKHGTGTLYPTSLEARFDAERWMDWQICHVLPPLITLFFGLIRTPPEKRDNAAIEAARLRAEEAFRIFDGHMAGRDYVCGDSLTMADIPLGAFGNRWALLPIERPALKNFEAWLDRLKRRPAFQRRVMLPLK